MYKCNMLVNILILKVFPCPKKAAATPSKFIQNMSEFPKQKCAKCMHESLIILEYISFCNFDFDRDFILA